MWNQFGVRKGALIPELAMEQCKVLDSAVDTVVVAFELVKSEARIIPERLARALESPEVQEEIRKALLAEAERRLQAQAGPTDQPPSKDGKDFAIAVSKAGGPPLLESVKQQVANSPRGKELQDQLDRFVKDFKCSPVGVWIDEHKGLVIVAGVVGALGAAAGMYMLRSGDSIARLTEGRAFNYKLLGTIDISGAITKFKPSGRSIGGQLSASADLTWVKTTLSLSGTATGPRAEEASVAGEIVVPLGRGVVSVASGRLGVRDVALSPSAFPGRPEYDYQTALGIRFNPAGGVTMQILGKCEPSKCSGEGSVGMSGKARNVPYRLGLTGNVETSGAFQIGTTLTLDL